MEEVRREGGHLVPAYASWATDEVIVDAITVVEALTGPLRLVYEVSETSFDDDVGKRSVTIDGKVYWELNYPANRNDYEDLKTGSPSPAEPG